MNKVIKNIVEGNRSDKEKRKAIDALCDDIEMAKGILDGKYKYCSKCDDYYLTESYLSDTETENTKICVWKDPINSGGDEYEDGYVKITYSICPKGHKQEVNRKESRR